MELFCRIIVKFNYLHKYKLPSILMNFSIIKNDSGFLLNMKN